MKIFLVWVKSRVHVQSARKSAVAWANLSVLHNVREVKVQGSAYRWCNVANLRCSWHTGERSITNSHLSRRYHAHGCETELPASAKAEHEKHCPYRPQEPVPCSFSPCPVPADPFRGTTGSGPHRPCTCTVDKMIECDCLRCTFSHEESVFTHWH